MTNPARYRAREIEYDALTDDERNGIVAVLEGWRVRKGISYDLWEKGDEGGEYHRSMSHPNELDYLHDKALCFDLIEKYSIPLTPMWRDDEVEGWTTFDWRPENMDKELQAAIVHAACEIAREQHNG